MIGEILQLSRDNERLEKENAELRAEIEERRVATPTMEAVAKLGRENTELRRQLREMAGTIKLLRELGDGEI